MYPPCQKKKKLLHQVYAIQHTHKHKSEQTHTHTLTCVHCCCGLWMHMFTMMLVASAANTHTKRQGRWEDSRGRGDITNECTRQCETDNSSIQIQFETCLLCSALLHGCRGHGLLQGAADTQGNGSLWVPF